VETNEQNDLSFEVIKIGEMMLKRFSRSIILALRLLAKVSKKTKEMKNKARKEIKRESIDLV